MMAYHKLAALAFTLTSILTAWKLYLLSWDSYTEVALLSSIDSILAVLLYRLTLHPLAKYPGPLLAACTDWYNVYWIAKAERHLEFDRQHERHGKIVRFGPNRISVRSAGASRDLGAVNANVLRSTVFSSFKKFFGIDSSATTLNPREHAFRRRINNQALTPGVLQDYDDRITPHIDFMIERLREGIPNCQQEKDKDEQEYGDEESSWGPAHNMTQALMYCVADIMADVVFGQPWNVQRDPRNRPYIENLAKSTTGLLVVGHMQTVFRLGLHWILFAPFVKDIIQFLLLAKSFAERRAGQITTTDDDDLKKTKRDVWGTLLTSKDAETGQHFTQEQLISEAGMFITAGTGTTILTTSSTLFYLLRNPHAMDRLTREIRTTFPPPDKCLAGQPPPASSSAAAEAAAYPIRWGSPELKEMSYLYGCIYEALRLSPGLPGISPRVAGPGGVLLDGVWFPEGTELGVPFWSLFRQPEHFHEPLLYKPERWIPITEGGGDGEGLQPGVVGSAGAPFTPFGQGRFGCLGRQLATQEITLILARLVWLFDMRQEPGNNLGGGVGAAKEGRRCPDEFQLLDRFTGDGNGPSVQFKYRML